MSGKEKSGYSLVEVMIAAAVVAIGVSAGAILVGALVAQTEQDHISLRAANLQEQAINLYRFGVTNSGTIAGLMPEKCTNTSTPAAGVFSILFSTEGSTNVSGNIGGGSGTIAINIVTNSLIYRLADPSSGSVQYLTNTQTVLLPSIRIR